MESNKFPISDPPELDDDELELLLLLDDELALLELEDEEELVDEELLLEEFEELLDDELDDEELDEELESPLDDVLPPQAASVTDITPAHISLANGN